MAQQNCSVNGDPEKNNTNKGPPSLFETRKGRLENFMWFSIA